MQPSISDVLAMQVPFLAVDEFVDSSLCNAIVDTIRHDEEWREAEVPPEHEHLFVEMAKPHHLFLSQYMVRALNPDEHFYLDRCQHYNDRWTLLTSQWKYDPWQAVATWLNDTAGIKATIAQRDGRSYCPVAIRDLSDVVLAHADYAPIDGAGWAIGDVATQLAWNIYLTDPGEGGDVILYDKIWNPEDALDDDSYGIKTMTTPELARFHPRVGQLVFFNPRYFHMVTKSTRSRMAIGGFVGLTSDGRALAWA